MAMTGCPYSLEKISDFVFCIRENGNLLIYFISGEEKSILIDTGSGAGNLYEFIQKEGILKQKQKLIVINTHNHAEQVGG